MIKTEQPKAELTREVKALRWITIFKKHSKEFEDRIVSLENLCGIPPGPWLRNIGKPGDNDAMYFVIYNNGITSGPGKLSLWEWSLRGTQFSIRGYKIIKDTNEH